MSTKNRILVHGTMAAAALALIGYMYAQLAGVWAASQTTHRTAAVLNPSTSDIPAASAEEIAGMLMWRVPLTMAAMGFAIVAIGEGLLGLWRKPVARPTDTRTHDEKAEELIQQLLKDTEATKHEAADSQLSTVHS